MPKRPAPPPPPELHLIAIADIRPDPAQPRQIFDDRTIAELADSIREVGLVQPITVRPLPGGGFVLVAGERRWRAYLLLAATDDRFLHIPAVVQARDDAQARLAALVENVVRQDLDPIERAEALQTLRKALGTTWKGVAQRTGLGERRVRQLAGLSSLSHEVRRALRDGGLHEKHARAVRMLGRRRAALDLCDWLRHAPETTGDEALAVARVMKRHEGLSAHAAAERLRQGHPAAQLRPEPKLLDNSHGGRIVATLKGLVRGLETLAGEPPRAGQRTEILQLVDRVSELGGELRGQWLDELLAE